MEKLQFEFTVAGTLKDEKTNTIVITSIATTDGRKFVLPEDCRFVGDHVEILKTESFRRVKNSLRKRYQFRRVWIKLSEKLKQVYLDEDENIMFRVQYLEEIEEKEPKRLIEVPKRKEGEGNLKHLADKFVIEKFTSRHSNAKQWMETFEKECARFEIVEDEMKIEVLRLFMEKPCSDWYYATWTKLTIDAAWDEWKDRFIETFADKGWFIFPRKDSLGRF